MAFDLSEVMIGMLVVETIAKIRRAYFQQKKAIKAICREFGGFDAYLRTILPTPAQPLLAGSAAGQIPASTPASIALSKDLQARGFRFVGPTITYAFMQSVGLVDDHLPGCFRYRG